MKLVVALMPASLPDTLYSATNLPEVTKESFNADTDAILDKPVDLQELTQFLENPNIELLIGYQYAECEIADSLANGGTLESAKSAWGKKARELLNFQKKQRSRIQLFNLQHAECNIQRFVDKLGLTCSPTSGNVRKDVEMNPFLPLACQAVRQSTDLALLATEAFASSIRLSEKENVSLDIDGYIQHCTNLVNAKNRLKSTVQEAELLLLQLQQTQEEMEALHCSNLKLEKELEKGEIAALNCSDEKTLIKIQLKNLQAELEAYYLKSSQLAKKVQTLKGDNEQLKTTSNQLFYNNFLLKQECADFKRSYFLKGISFVRKLARGIIPSARARHAESQRRLADASLLSTSPYFNAQWYRQKYQDVKTSGINPFEHYLLYGGREGRQPSPGFDSKRYLERYADVSSSGMNPLLHYIKFGQKEGRIISAKPVPGKSRN